MAERRVPENLKKQLALAVRTIQWSYGIFWSISDRQPGVLEWGVGYYNGDIKTRKTVQSVEFNADQMAFQRSEQLKELYESLSAGEANPQARRPSAALSPEDLTDLEWYYLVCMSFVFNIGQGLPGRTLATGQPIWLRNAHYADSKVFSRSLLAKSASIQTVVCFPYLGGVIELGVTEMVMEDPSLIQLVKNSYLEIPNPAGSKKPDTKDHACVAFDRDIFDGPLLTVVGCEELEMVSLNNSSSEFEANQFPEDSFLLEGINGGASQVQSFQFLDDEISNCVHNSMNSSDCISQTFADPEKIVSAPKGGKVIDYPPPDPQEFKHAKLASTAHQSDDLHFQNVLSSLLKSSHQLILGPHFRNSNKESSFVSWKTVGLVSGQKPRSRASQQKVLKKVLFEVPKMHNGGLVESPGDDCDHKDGVWRPEADEIGINHVMGEKKEKLDERFLILKTLVPSISKVDKVSILDTTIEYLKQLEKRVEELEPSREMTVSGKRKPEDTVERTSDNYGHDNTENGKRRLVGKRKAVEIDKVEPETSYVVSSDLATDNLTISIHDKDVVIELRCPWREGLLLEVMDVVSNLRLDSHSVQSTTNDGIISLTIKSKVKESTATSASLIRRALQRFTVM